MAEAQLPAGVARVAEADGIREYKLENGMKVLLVENRVAPVATVMVLYKVGSRNEAVGYTGSTHLLEHMMFKGTPTFNKEKNTQIAATLQKIGAAADLFGAFMSVVHHHFSYATNGLCLYHLKQLLIAGIPGGFIIREQVIHSSA